MSFDATVSADPSAAASSTPPAFAPDAPAGPAEGIPSASAAPELPQPAWASGDDGYLGGYEPPEELADPQALERMLPIMREAGLSGEQARKLVESYFAMRGEQLRELEAAHGRALAGDATIPDSSAGYRYDVRGIQGAADVLDEDSVSAMSDVFHRVGLSQRQASEVVKAYAARMAGLVREAGDTDTARQALAGEWGTRAPQQIEQAAGAFRQLFGHEAPQIARLRLSDGSLLGNRPEVVRAFARLAITMKPGTIPQAPPPKPPPVAPPNAPAGSEGLQAEIQKLEADPALLDRQHARHAAVIARRSALYARLYPAGE